MYIASVSARGGVEDTRLEAKAKNTHKKIRGQGQEQPYLGQTLSRPRTGMLEARSKDESASALQKKNLQNYFLGDLQKKFSGASQIFSSKTSAVLEPRTGQFSRTWDQGQGHQNVSSRPRTSLRTPPLVSAITLECHIYLWKDSSISAMWQLW